MGRLPDREYRTLNGILPCMYISHIYYVPFIWKEFLPGNKIWTGIFAGSHNRDLEKSGTIHIM